MKDKVQYAIESLGSRIQQARLQTNLTQLELADLIGMSRTAIEGAERGKCTLTTFVKIMDALNVLGQLENFLPVQAPSPVMLAKAKGKVRQRASRTKKGTYAISENLDDLDW